MILFISSQKVLFINRSLRGPLGGKRARLYGCTAGERPGCGRQREGRRREIKEGKGWSEKQGDNR